jgi:predicted ATPase/DNA-binding XRE family transcriptional regulator
MAFADLLTKLRTARGLSQEELAAHAGVSVRAISDLERGITHRPQRETVRSLAGALDLGRAERDAFERAARQTPLTARVRRGRGVPSRVSLPAPVTSIVGRDADVAAVERLVRGSSARMVTVTGPGGVGKTRLAVEVAWRVRTGFDRVDAVDLSPLASPEDVPAALAAALGDRTGVTGSIAGLAARIGDTPWLLLLDSFEHVIGAAADLAELLADCPRLNVLITSRAHLRLRGEHLWPLAPLPAPPIRVTDLGLLGANPAVALLVERVRAVRPGFGLTAGNAAAVAKLCRRLDGLPLAIELAAARLRTREPDELVTLLRQRPTQLRSEAVDVPGRHQSLRAAVEWSTEQLSPTGRLIFGVLAAFPGGANVPAVRAVAAAGGARSHDVDDAVAMLVSGSLVSVVDGEAGARVGMLDTIREVGLELLAASGAEAAVRRAQAEYVVDLVLRAPDEEQGYERVDAELDNVRAGLGWAVASAPVLLDAPVVRALTAYYASRGHFPEALRILRAIADAVPEDGARAYALHGAGLAANESGDQHTAITLAERASEIFGRLGDTSGRCATLSLIGNAHKATGGYDLARTAHRASLDLARELGDMRRVAITLNNLGTLAHDLGDHELAHRHYEESLRVKRDLADERGVAVALLNLGDLARDRNRYREARTCAQQAADLFRAHGERRRLAHALTVLADAACGLGQHTEATDLANEALAVARSVDYRPGIGLALARLGDLARARGAEEEAGQHYRRALDHINDAAQKARVLRAMATAEPGASQAPPVPPSPSRGSIRP